MTKKPLDGDDKRYFDRIGQQFLAASGLGLFFSLLLAYVAWEVPTELLYIAWPPNLGLANSEGNLDVKLRTVFEINAVFSACLCAWLASTFVLRFGSRSCLISNKVLKVSAIAAVLSFTFPMTAGYTDDYSIFSFSSRHPLFFTICQSLLVVYVFYLSLFWLVYFLVSNNLKKKVPHRQLD
ncbi:MAG: hypothetical protein ACK4QP_04130 [Pseudorhizobium sp.]